MRDDSTEWLMFGGKRAAARVRLFCFHHAGGAASMYRKWAEELPQEVDTFAIQLPGREFRIREAPLTKLEAILQELVRVLGPQLDRPFAFFGHSMGATVAFELARELRRRGASQPVHLGVSGRIAPHLHSRFKKVQQLTDAELVAKLRQVGGLPDYVLNEPELMAHVLPLVRADYVIVDGYQYVPEPPLACSVSAYWGQRDVLATEDEVSQWRQHTTGNFTLHGFPGDHTFLANARPDILRILRAALEAAPGA
jgi:surfactin synthase thioesterase subunit